MYNKNAYRRSLVLLSLCLKHVIAEKHKTSTAVVVVVVGSVGDVVCLLLRWWRLQLQSKLVRERSELEYQSNQPPIVEVC
jgi:hypothetical protein